MYFISKIFSLLCVLIFISNLDFGSAYGQKMGGGGLVLVDDHHHKKDLIVFQQKGCSPSIIKTSKHGKGDMIVLGQCKKMKKEVMKKYVPVPVPVKEYVPVPMPVKEYVPVKQYIPVYVPIIKKKVNQANQINQKKIKKKQMPIEMEHAPFGEAMYGMDTKNLVTIIKPDNTEATTQRKEEPTPQMQIKRFIRIRKLTKKEQN